MRPGNTQTPEGRARDQIDRLIEESGWVIQWRSELNLQAGRGVAVREFLTNNGPADYVLFLDGRAVGVVEAKPAGHTLSGVMVQARNYASSLEDHVPTPIRPLPFLYVSTGADVLPV